MRQQLIATMLLLLVVGVAFIIKNIYYHEATNEVAFYFQLLFWIGGLLAALFSLNILWQSMARQKQREPGRHDFKWPNRRQSFRVVYPRSQCPMLIVERTGNRSLRNLEFPVADISEGGICFLDDGSFGTEDDLSGRLVFKQGENARISGHIVRRDENRISVKLRRNLAWGTILKEQRNLMSHLK